MSYTRRDLIKVLIDEFDAGETLANRAVERFGTEVANLDHSMILEDPPNGNTVFDGDVQRDAEYVYDKQEFWIDEPTYLDKLSEKDGEL